jgi:hypothetical protein
MFTRVVELTSKLGKSKELVYFERQNVLTVRDLVDSAFSYVLAIYVGRLHDCFNAPIPRSRYPDISLTDRAIPRSSQGTESHFQIPDRTSLRFR